MEEWPPISYGDEDERPAPDDGGSRTDRYPDRFSEAVGDVWESGIRREIGELDGML